MGPDDLGETPDCRSRNEGGAIMNGKLTRRGFVALAGGLLIGGALAGTTFAQQAPVDPDACPMGFGDGRRAGWGQGVGAGPGAGRGRGFGPAAGQPGVAHEAIAAALGMTSDELFAAQRGGKTVADLAQEKGVDLETVVRAAVGAHKQALDAQVQTGQVTQTQADQLQARMEAQIRGHVAEQYGPGGQGGPGFGPGMGRGRHGPGMGSGFGPRGQGQ
jgi:hypothetical protein